MRLLRFVARFATEKLPATIIKVMRHKENWRIFKNVAAANRQRVVGIRKRPVNETELVMMLAHSSNDQVERPRYAAIYEALYRSRSAPTVS